MAQSADVIKVLLVDDEEEFLESTCKVLSRRKLAVSTASNGMAALTILENEVFDVVVLDEKMPGLSGEEVYQRIRVLHPGLAVIMLTGHGTVNQAFEMSKDGVFDYLSKPCDMDELEKRIGQAVFAGRAKRAALAGEGDGATGELISVLLVDDENELLHSLQTVLERRGMRVFTATSGNWALQLLKGVDIDVVVLDIKMPGLDGLETLRLIKRDYSDREVILLTGHPNLENAITGIREGALEYLTKPPDIDALCHQIRQAWTKRRSTLRHQQQRVIRRVIEQQPD